MKSILTPEEQSLISEFYISPHYQVIKKLLLNQIDRIQKMALGSKDMDELREYRALAIANKGVLTNIKRIHDDYSREKGRKNASKKS